jgi:hypothetical protein
MRVHGARVASMNVLAFTTPACPQWRWRIVNYAGEMIEESQAVFSTIAIAVAEGRKRLEQMNQKDDSVPRQFYRSTTYLRGR